MASLLAMHSVLHSTPSLVRPRPSVAPLESRSSARRGARRLLTVGLATAVSHDEWRQLLVLNSAPALAVFALTFPFVRRHESPRWLLVMGSDDLAAEMIERIASQQSSHLSGGRECSPLLSCRCGAQMELCSPRTCLSPPPLTRLDLPARSGCLALARRFTPASPQDRAQHLHHLNPAPPLTPSQEHFACAFRPLTQTQSKAV